MGEIVTVIARFFGSLLERSSQLAQGLQRSKLNISDDSLVVIAQYAGIKGQIPHLYVLLIINAIVASFTFWNLAPDWITIGGGMLLVSVCAWRLFAWTLFATPASTISVESARAILRRTTFAVVPISVGFTGYALLLDQYAGTLEHASIVVCIAITVIGCIFCLIHLPKAAMLVQVIALLPFAAYHIYHGSPVFIAMAINVVIVTCLMVRVLLKAFAAFTNLILSQARLANQQRETGRLAEDNERLAMTDVLTGLPNRRMFFASLERWIAECGESGGLFAVGVLDLDRFKPVNDVYGHAVGDCLLAAVGARLASVAGEGAIVARLGGDEFGLLIRGDAAAVASQAQQVCDCLSRTFEIDEIQLSLGCSIGIALFPDAGSSVMELFDRSDYSLYKVKSSRRGGYALFSSAYEDHRKSQLALEAAVQAMNLNAELQIEFQPIINLDTMEVLDVEALCRWKSPVIGAVEPEQFITTAERLGLMNPITMHLFHLALLNCLALPKSIGLSFNLSAHDITSGDTVRQLVQYIRETGFDPKRITFEITETSLMRDLDAAIAGIGELRALGAAIALDDFGMGYSSLSYLNRLPLDKVKVDRSFVADMDEVSGSKIISAVLALCNAMELDCIIEGVETESQVRQLREMGCQVAQGYLFCPPVPLRNLSTWLAGQSQNSQPPPVRKIFGQVQHSAVQREADDLDEPFAVAK